MNGKRLPFFALSDKYEISCSLTIKYQVFRSLDASCSGLTVNKAYDRSRAVVKNNPRFALRKTALSFFPFLVWLLKREIFACRTAIKVVITTGAQQEIARKPTDVIFLDLSKAFDSVSHERLLLKLNRHGIDGPLLLWFRNFLTI